MNPLVLLMGLFGAGAIRGLGGSKNGADKTTSPHNNRDDQFITNKPTENETDPVSAPSTNVDDTVGSDTTTGGDMTGGDMTGGDMTHGDMTHGDTTGGDMDGGMHHDTPPAIMPPASGATQAEIDAYVDAIMSAGEVHVHDSGSSKASEHDAVMNLVPRDEATHIAVSDGDWFDPSTWYNGEVPGDDARVLIPDGISVDYGQVSDARLFTVRVDGTLNFATDANSQMIFDTFVVSPTGHLIIGSETDPVDPDVNVDLIVANNGPIDTNWDPMLLSRGLISHGETSIQGATKDSHEKVIDDPMAGDRSVSFAEMPEGWQVGDTIVIAGTRYDGYKWDHDAQDVLLYPNEDEIRVITAIEGSTVYFETPLEHDHDTPREDLKTSVANYTRNVSIETENAAEAEVYERGHVMFMHSDNVEVRYMEFHELGRTDKSEPSQDISQFDTVNFDSNVQGRYSLHLHRTGLEDPAILEGNAVYGSPGWGIVQHDSNAMLTNNATFDTFGAGFVAETGNETGVWSDNIAIYAEGISWDILKNTSDADDNVFDTGRGGEGFWFQGRLLEVYDNVAASVNTGFAYFHRDSANLDRMIDFDPNLFAYSDALYSDGEVAADETPILFFSGNETFASNEGLHVVKSSTIQGHDVWTHLDDFTAWSVVRGVHLQYTAHYLLTDFDLIGKDSTDFSTPQEGILLGNNMNEVVIRDSSIDNFQIGIDLTKTFVDVSNPASDHQYVLIDNEITNVAQTYANYDPSIDRILTASDLPGLDPDISINALSYSWSNEWITISGTKTDTLGTVEFPAGLEDHLEIAPAEFIHHLNTEGYWTTSDGQNYALINVYFTDRATGEVFYETHPVMIAADVALGHPTMNSGDWANAVFNGPQDIVSSGGVVMAGDQVLYEPIAATPFSNQIASASTMLTSQSSLASDIWLDGYDGSDPLELHVYDGIFANTGTVENADLSVSGGETVLALDNAEFDVGESRTLAVFEAAAKIGFDGAAGGTAILDLHEGATLAFGTVDGDLATIEEFDSAAVDGSTSDVASGIDLGGSTLTIDLSGLSADAGTAFTLMDSDELVGVFSEAAVGGLGARDATITIDYVNDSVSLELTEGNGVVNVETLGEETDVDAGEEALWAALTADQGVFSETPAEIVIEEDEEFLAEAA